MKVSALTYFSDNITTVELAEHVKRFADHDSNPGCLLLSRGEQPQAFGVAKFDSNGNIIDIIEKPGNPPQTLPLVTYLMMSNFGI